jgi:hypothetical protein
MMDRCPYTHIQLRQRPLHSVDNIVPPKRPSQFAPPNLFRLENVEAEGAFWFVPGLEDAAG